MMDELLASILSPEQLQAARQQALTQGLLGGGFALLQASQGQPGQGRPNLGQIIGQAGPVGMQAYQGSFDRTLQEVLAAQKIEEAKRMQAQQRQQQEAIDEYVSTLPEDQQARFRAFPTQAAEQMFREPKPAPGVVGEFQAAKASGEIPAETTLPQYIEMKKQASTIVNVGTGDKLTEFEKKRDQKFAEDALQWQQGGGQDMTAQIAQLKPVIEALERNEPLTGPMVAVAPDLVLAIANPKALQAREQVEEVVQRNLRAILGAQFTEKEGERLIARAYNPKLSPQQNAGRVRRLFKQMAEAAEQKQAMVDYATANGTLKGFQGKMPSIQDFVAAIEGGEREEAQPKATKKRSLMDIFGGGKLR
jgi:hypothetical protein